jgi:DENN domain-containing protein 2
LRARWYVSVLRAGEFVERLTQSHRLPGWSFAAAALLQPFDWQHIFIPVMSMSYLPYCGAPQPYMLGLTPAQFSQLCEEAGVGEVVLVALDEGYVAALNGSIPLVDLDGVNASNANTGMISSS